MFSSAPSNGGGGRKSLALEAFPLIVHDGGTPESWTGLVDVGHGTFFTVSITVPEGSEGFGRSALKCDARLMEVRTEDFHSWLVLYRKHAARTHARTHSHTHVRTRVQPYVQVYAISKHN